MVTLLLETAYAKKVFEDRYAQRKPDGSLETFDEALRRVAKAAALDNGAYGWTQDVQEQHFHDMMRSGAFLPGGRILANLGGTGNGMLGNCFVIPIEDSLEGIFTKGLTELVKIEASGGGVGTNFSPLRPKGCPIGGSGGFSSGPVSFMRVYDSANCQISQGGTRRGAAIGVLNVSHPDTMEFIDAKAGTESALTSYNISVGISDAFMQAVEDDTPWTMSWNGLMEKTLPAREIYRKLCGNAWANGEPGVLFLTTVNRLNPLDAIEEIDATNPCGEVPLVKYGMCDLGAINMSHFAPDHKLSEWEHTIKTAVLFLDNCLDLSTFPLPEIEQEVKNKRRIGLGVFGLADYLFKSGLTYGDDPASLDHLSDLFYSLQYFANKASEELGVALGAYPAYELDPKDLPKRRNGTLISCPPTGTISRLYGCSSGVEPYFALALAFTERLGSDTFSYKALDGYTPDNLPANFRCTNGPDWSVLSTADHLAVVKAIAPFVDSAISKTVTLPNSATIEDVEALLMEAWKGHLKGITVYREGSRSLEAIKAVSDSPDPFGDEFEELLYDEAELTTMAEEIAEEMVKVPKKRPPHLEGTTYKIKYNPAKPALFITINDFEELPFEIFINTEDATQKPGFDALCLTLTALFRSGNTGEFLIEKLLKYETADCGAFYNGKFISSSVAAIGTILKEHLQSLEIVEPDADPITLKKMADEGMRGERCPVCFQHTAFREEGCIMCATCGFSKCG